MYDIVLPKVEEVSTTNNYGTFRIEPLERGFGTTVGNAMRRVLLSSLPGVAVDSIRVDGIYHEFTHMEGVKEDVTQIILNIKQLRLRSTVEHPAPLRLEVRGPGRVTAADIQCPPEVEVVNLGLPIMTLDSPDAFISIEMTTSRGKGYSPAEDREGQPIGTIPVDAIYSPVKKVNFSIEELRIGNSPFERLVLEVWTDSTISPTDAVAESAQILIEHLKLLVNLAAKPAEGAGRGALAALAIPPKLYQTSIDELELSVRAYNCLKRAGITTIGQVLELGEEDLLAVRNFGHKSLEELREKLIAHNYIDYSRLTSIGAMPEEEVWEEAEVEARPAAKGETAVTVEWERPEEREKELISAELEKEVEEKPPEGWEEEPTPRKEEPRQEIGEGIEPLKFEFDEAGEEEEEGEQSGRGRRKKKAKRRAL